MEQEYIFDMTEENKPQKTISKKTKKKIMYLICIIIGIAVAVLGVLLFDFLITGAPSPEEAVAEYQKAALTYDVDNMIEYSSEYNKTVLHGNQATDDKTLKDYLEKGYEGYSATYDAGKMSFKLVSVLEYNKGEGRFDEITADYAEKASLDDVTAAAIVRMTIYNGRYETTRDYVAVKCGSRWYFAYALSWQTEDKWVLYAIEIE